jgi:hypothetical protein
LLQRTRIPCVQKDPVLDASRLLDLGGLAVSRVASDAFGGRVVHVVTADETAPACPSCGVLSVALKGLVCTRPRDIPYGTGVTLQGIEARLQRVDGLLNAGASKSQRCGVSCHALWLLRGG